MFTELQREVEEHDKRCGFTGDKPGHITLHMIEELGEVSREVLRLEGYKKEGFVKERLGQELSDLIYLSLKLANTLGVDLDGHWSLMPERLKGKSRGE